ncbi:Protein of unknown function [Pyronema omphalodes CBS 100304]|uniref:Uncharacterized protein n=1 Tax=Pyronema omphalodes (strain CBS 100304) TaxID=1076935 RepID=U4LE19_PYROM|nr:Protein of unknown function [Pyronema omphalodes CBS 100304]
MRSINKHLEKVHIGYCCPYCFKKIKRRFGNIKTNQFEKIFFNDIQAVIQHVRCRHFKPWKCRGHNCNSRFGAKAKYNKHIKEFPGHITQAQRNLDGYLSQGIKTMDHRLGKMQTTFDIEADRDFKKDILAETRIRRDDASDPLCRRTNRLHEIKPESTGNPRMNGGENYLR